MRYPKRGRFPLRLAVAIAACLLVAGGGGGGPQGPAQGRPAYAPQQAIVFHGSLEPEDAFFVALSQSGYLIDLGDGPEACPSDTHEAGTGIQLASAPDQGVSQNPLFRPRPYLLGLAREPEALPVALDELSEDCEFLAAFAAVESYLEDVSAEAVAVLPEVALCVDEVRLAHCRLMEKISTVVDPATLTPICILGDLGDDGGFVSDLPLGCERVDRALGEIQGLLNRMKFLRDACRVHLEIMELLMDDLCEALTHDDWYNYIPIGCVLLSADDALSNAEEAFAEAFNAFAKLHTLKAEVDLEFVEAACEECQDKKGPGGGRALRGFSSLPSESRRQPLGRLVGAFQKASNAEEDPAQALRLEEIAHRLARAPNDRVLHVTYRSSSPIGQELVAVRSTDYPPEPGRPEVAVITALPAEAPWVPFTLADQVALSEAYRTFAEILGDGRLDPGGR